ncbi:hypothetical protein V6N13_087142 [Hibiscus sabdariffa]|uniref:RING-CH-type domain-containing protein n=1 Tax=Hibiscus sabdariffa TaxID=183260 RepID=A0ABR2FVB2_9ROSI
MGDVILFIDDSSSNSSVSLCRICHEQEFESFKSLEAPCACSGTVKFAHRDCIQRWCNQKGNTTCEICLQEYGPGYTVTLHSNKSRLIEAAVIIRDSQQTRGTEAENERLVAFAEEMNVENELFECTLAADRSASCCRSLALTFTVVLVVKHLFAVLNGETDHYPFALVTILFFRVTGIILPMYILIRTMTIIRNSIRRQYQERHADISNSDEEDNVEQLRNA